MRFTVTLLALSLIFASTVFCTESEKSSSVFETPKPAFTKSAPSIAPLASTQTRSGLVVSTFATPQGTLRLYLPDDANAGDQVSGLITAQPAGQTKTEKDMNLGEIASFNLVFDSKTSPVIDGKAKWRIPVSANSIVIVLQNKDGKEIGRTDIPLQDSKQDPIAAFGLAGVSQIGKPIQINGPFDGDLDNTQIDMNGQQLNVIAESPRRVIVAAPEGMSGLVTLQLKENQQSMHCSYQAVGISLSAPKTSLSSGEETTVTIAVDGLTNVNTNVALELKNESPGIVNMEGGSVQNIDISPGQVPSDGVYKTTRALIGLGDGSFQLAARLLQQPAMQTCIMASLR